MLNPDLKLNKPRVIWDWVYWIMTMLIILVGYIEIVGCDNKHDLPVNFLREVVSKIAVFCPQDSFFFPAVFTVIIFFGIIVFIWAIITVLMFVRAVIIKKKFETNMYLYIYIIPLLFALFELFENTRVMFNLYL